MSETVTITLTTELAERAHETANLTGKSIEEVLTEWLEQASVETDSNLPQIEGTYEVWSPFDEGNAVSTLEQVLNEDKRKNGEQ